MRAFAIFLTSLEALFWLAIGAFASEMSDAVAIGMLTLAVVLALGAVGYALKRTWGRYTLVAANGLATLATVGVWGVAAVQSHLFWEPLFYVLPSVVPLLVLLRAERTVVA